MAEENLGEIYVKIKADVDDLKKEIAALKTSGPKETEAIGKSMGSKLGKGFATALVATGAITILIALLKKSVQAYASQELAETRLRTALGKTSKYLLDQATALQKVTVQADENIITAQSLIAAYTKDEKEINALTRASLDLAAAKKKEGMSLESAADLVAKSYGSSTNALKRQGLEIKGLAGSTERLKSITEGIAELWGGQAEAQGKTFTGRLEIMKNKIGEVEERIGKALVPTLEKFVGAIGDAATATEQADTFFQGLAAAGRVVGSVFLVLRGLMLEVGSYIGTVGAAVYALVSGNFALIPGIISDGFNKMVDTGKQTVTDLGNMWSDLTTKYADEETKKRKIFDDTQKHMRDKQYEPSDIKAKHIGIDTESWEREKKIMFENTDLMKLKRGELAFYMKEVNQGTLDNSKFTNEAIYQDWLDKNEGIKNSVDDLSAAMTDGLFNQMRVQGEWANSMLEQSFASLADAAIAQIQRIAAEWAAMAFLRLLFGVATGGASAVTATPAHSGGNFIGTNNGVKKLAGGGSFIVPPGFPNDSYPLLVESGERVSVNSASNVGLQDRHLSNISKKLDGLAILNSNFLESTMRKSKQQAIPIYGKIEGQDIYVSNKRVAKQIGRMG